MNNISCKENIAPFINCHCTVVGNFIQKLSAILLWLVVPPVIGIISPSLYSFLYSAFSSHSKYSSGV